MYCKEIRFRLTPEEKEALVTLAEDAGLSQSAFVRRLINKRAKKRGMQQAAKGGKR